MALALAAALSLAAAAPGAGRAREPVPAAETAAPDSSLSDAEVRQRVEAYLGSIDTPISRAEWRALGPRAAPILEQVIRSPDELPSRRAAALGALGAIGGPSARLVVLETARAGSEPFAVRAAALRSAPAVLGSEELVRELTPVMEGARQLGVRAVAAEVLARNAPAACGAVRAQAGRERPEAGGHFARALRRCGGP